MKLNPMSAVRNPEFNPEERRQEAVRILIDQANPRTLLYRLRDWYDAYVGAGTNRHHHEHYRVLEEFLERLDYRDPA